MPIALLGALLLCATLATPGSAATIRVPGDHPTVRAAVAAAASGDTVLIAPGDHIGGVWITGKVLTMASWYVLAGDTAMVAQTVLNGVEPGACGGVLGCTGNAVLEFGDNANGSRVVGLTITNGENGIASGSTVDVTRCRVIANGDGVDYVAGSGGTIRNSLFAGNSDDGIDLNGRMNMAILDNEIRDNADDGIEYRLYAYTGAMRQVDIIGNRITGNGEDGVQIIDYPGASNYIIRIERNLFRTNFDASGLSAAIAFMPDGLTIESLVGAPAVERVFVVNNTFIGEKNGVVGGANVIALNNLFADIQGTALRRVGGGSIASYSLFWGNGINHFESIVDTPNNLYASPWLDSIGRLTPPSPAIDRGTAFFQWQGQTVLNMAPSGYAGSAPDLGAFETAANTAPQVSAGPNITVTLAHDAVVVAHTDILGPEASTLLRADAGLHGSVGDDGLPYPPAPNTTWSVVRSPGPVTFSNPSLPVTDVSFTVPGVYILRLTMDDGLLNGWDQVQVTVHPALNLPPVVDAGSNRTLTLPAGAALAGTVIDDGLPIPPGATTSTWSQTSGPDAAIIQNPNGTDTQVSFPSPGIYVLWLTASDGALTAADSVVVTVLPPPNTPPQVEAGPNQIITLPADALLDGTVADDGLPNPPGAVTITWIKVVGPGTVTFQNPSLVNTRATFTTPGTYLLRLVANDGVFNASDVIQVTVQPPPVVERRIATGSDDTEERRNGTIETDSGDLDLVYEAGNQTVGLRFTDVVVPTGATILAAYIQFVADAAHGDPANLLLEGQATDDPGTYSSEKNNISSRPRTAASVNWSPAPWTVVGEAGALQRTTELKTIIQELVDRSGWASGNAMAIIITGTGKRTARTQEIHPASAALLHIQYAAPAVPVAAASPPSEVAAEAPAPVPVRSVAALQMAPSAGLDLALNGVRPQPAFGAMSIELTLADDRPAALELLDIAGRRVAARELGALGPGRHVIDLREQLPAGLYLIRLTQGARAVVRKAIVLE